MGEKSSNARDSQDRALEKLCLSSGERDMVCHTMALWGGKGQGQVKSYRAAHRGGTPRAGGPQ